ncbi:MAG: hypothetical protein K2N53_07095 [Clostridia bacterium]|nr:hypothetical protein [Clostridia bacterium]
MSQRLFGWLSKDAVTGLLIMLSILMALLLVFLVWEFAGDIRRGDEEDSDENESGEQEQNEEQERPRIELLPVYTVANETVVEEGVVLQDDQEQSAVTDDDATSIEIAQSQEEENSATQALREGIALVMPDEDETGEMGVRYDRSFTAKLIQSDDEVKEWYSDLKNYLMSFRKVHARTSWGRESFRIGRDCFARLAIKGKTLCIFLAIIPLSCQDTKYKIEDLADLSSCKDTPCLYRIKSNRRVAYAKELIDIILQEYGAKPIKNREAVDYYLPYEGTVDLIKRGLIKRKIVAKRADFLTKINSPSDGENDIGAA